MIIIIKYRCKSRLDNDMILYGLAELNKICVFQNNNTYNIIQLDFRHLIWCKQSIIWYIRERRHSV